MRDGIGLVVVRLVETRNVRISVAGPEGATGHTHEAEDGIEPSLTDLQSATLAFMLFSQGEAQIVGPNGRRGPRFARAARRDIKVVPVASQISKRPVCERRVRPTNRT